MSLESFYRCDSCGTQCLDPIRVNVTVQGGPDYLIRFKTEQDACNPHCARKLLDDAMVKGCDAMSIKPSGGA